MMSPLQANLILRILLNNASNLDAVCSAVREPLAKKRLVRVLDGFCTPFPGFFLYYPSRAQLAPKLKAWVDFFKYKPRSTRTS